MCKSIFENLYYGKINPYERKIEPTVESKLLEKEIEVEMNFLREQLSAESYQRLETLESLYNESSDMENVDNFAQGFKIGALIMLEVLAGAETITVE